MPRGRTTFRFAGTQQDVGARHVQVGQLVEARNVRQLKGGEYRKRRGFSRVDPLEVLVIDNATFRRGGSVLSQAAWSTASSAIAVTAEDTSYANLYNLAIPWSWAALGASRCVAGVTGLFTVATNNATVRIRTGGTPASRLGVAGTSQAGTTLLSVGANQTVDIVSAEFTPPSVLSYMMVTFEATAGTSNVTPQFCNPWIAPVGAGQMMALCDATVWVTSFSEVVRAEWYVDFGQFDASVSNVTLTLTGRTFQAVGGTGNYRIRIGGTINTADGTLVIDHARTGDNAADGTLSSKAVTIAKPSGVQLIKGCLVAGGASAELNGMSLLIKAA